MDAVEGYCGACHDWTGPGRYEFMGVSHHMHFDRQGQPITSRQWTMLLDDGGYRRVAEDTLVVADEPVWVSTVWVGLDMSFDFREGHVPVIFETLTFAGGGEAGDLGERYATETAALAGHDRMVARLLDTGAERRRG
jgi:hypothetical protein